jgi:hypothetical protein
MTKILKFSFLLVIFSLCFAIADVDAQNYGKKKKKKKKKPAKTEKTDDYFDDSGNFASKLWYGGGFNLGFSGDNITSAFIAGVSPMVGYKIVDQLSVGPIIGVQYNYLKGISTDGQIRKGDAVSWSAGVFARYKFLRTLFIHTEYGIENNEYVFFSGPYMVIDPNTGKVATTRQQQNNFYGGLGYNSGGDLLAFEMYVLYNFIAPDIETVNLPFTFRFGVTYKF